MWIQVNDDLAKQALSVLASQNDPVLTALKGRIEHYIELEQDPAAAAYRHAAMNSATDGELEFDDDAVVSIGGDPGAYVMGWFWVAASEAELEEEEAEEVSHVPSN